MSLLLGIDLGTSYFKVGLFERDGTLRGLGRVAVDKVSTIPGRFELSVDGFWHLLRRALGEALEQAGAAAADVAGVSYSSQANTFVLLDKAGGPLSPLVFWTDARAEVPAEFAAFSRTEAFRSAAGFEAVSTSSAVTKWRWFRDYAPALWSRARWLLTISDYLTYGLTGEIAGDASTAALLGLYHLQERRWWPAALAAFGVDPEKLATLHPPGSHCGRTTAAATRQLGLPAGIPFAVGGLDHHVAALGAGIDLFADASISTGTVLAALCVVDAVVTRPNCFHGPHLGRGRFFRLVFDEAGAGELDRFQRQFAPDRSLDELIAEAAQLPPGSETDAPPLSPGKVPERAAGMRALLDRIARTQRALVAAVSGGRTIRCISATGGGARSAAWLAIKADVIGIPIVTTACAERACLGAAAFAAVAAGIHATPRDALRAMVRPDRRFEPDPVRAARYRARVRSKS